MPSVFTPQVKPLRALTAVKVLAGGMASPMSPQQATVPSVFTPQVKPLPALTAVKVSAGGLACPEPLSPQQATVPSVFTAQVWKVPALAEPATALDGALAIEIPGAPVGGAAARATPGRASPIIRSSPAINPTRQRRGAKSALRQLLQ